MQNYGNNLDRPINNPHDTGALLTSFHANYATSGANTTPLSPEKKLGHEQQGSWSFADSERKPSSILETAATLWSSVINMCNTILGMGTLGVAYAIKYSGYIPAIFLLVLFGCMSFCGFYFQMYAAQQGKKKGVFHSCYKTISEVFCKRLSTAVDCTVIIHCYGACIAYLIIIGDLMPTVATMIIDSTGAHDQHLEILKNREFWIVFVTLIGIVPFIHQRELHSFRYLSVIVMLCFGYVIILLALEYLKAIGWMGDENTNFLFHKRADIHTSPLPHRTVDFIRVMPIYVAAFCGHPNAFTISNELERPSMPRLNIVILITIAVCTCIYAIAGFAAYFTYGDAVQPDVLLNCPHTIPVTIVRIALSIAVCCSYPVQLFPTRESISSQLFRKPAHTLNRLRFYLLTYGLVLISLGIALLVDDFSVVLIIISSVGCVGLDYCVPAVYYFYANPDNRFRRICAAIFFLVAISIMIGGLVCEGVSGQL